MKLTSRLFAALGLALGLCLAIARPAPAFTPQTITIDGVNDFLSANLVENDSADTQYSQLDLRRVYVTNDANKLYFGLGQDKTGWTTVQIGIMISTVANNGATNDMWGHRIAFGGTHTPGFGAYKNYDNNWQEWRTWTGTAWSSALRAGPGANGMSNGTPFQEIGLLLCELGVAAGDSIWFEIIVTQDGSTKGPLDLSKSDAVQLSTPGGTVFDPPSPITVSQTWGYRIQATGDSEKPTVTTAFKRQSFTVSVVYSEPVDLATSQTPSNYALGGTTAIIVDAVRRTSPCNIVDLSLSSNIGPKNGLYSVTVTNVKDQAGNTILANGTTNVAEFALKKLTFRGKMKYYLQNNSQPPNTFYVKADVAPLDFSSTCTAGLMTNTGVDSIFQTQQEFCVEKRSGAAAADTTLHWKFNHKCTTYEPLANNRQFLITSALGAEDTLEAWWNDQDPTQFLTHPIDVIFRVDMNGVVATGDTVAVNGNLLPLNWNVPSVTPLLDNGVAPDAVAGDKIFSKRVRYSIGSLKSLEFKYLRNRGYECSDSLAQGNRTAYLNDAAFDTTGGTLGPLTLPVGKWGYCTLISHPVKVVWKLKMNPSQWNEGSVASYATLNGAQEVPSNASTATGTGRFELYLDHYFRYSMDVTGLSSTETGAHIHGPAMPGQNAGVLFTLPLGAHKSGQIGPLNAAQERDLKAGLWYVNVHTTNYSGGEIRGQLIPTHSVAVRGSAAPLSWDSSLMLRDNGTAPDDVSGDHVYSGEAVFPTGTNLNVDWKYFIGSIYPMGYNRNVYLNDALFDETNPIVFNDSLLVTTDVPPPAGRTGKLVLRQNQPNPFNPVTRIDFEVPRGGHYRLSVYDALGRRVRVLLDQPLAAGPSTTFWNGLTDGGQRAPSGVYVYALEDLQGGRASRKMILLK